MVTTIAEQLSERHIDLRTLVTELHKAGLLSDVDRTRLVAANVGNAHPLVYLAELKLVNARNSKPLIVVCSSSSTRKPAPSFSAATLPLMDPVAAPWSRRPALGTWPCAETAPVKWHRRWLPACS